MIEAGERYAKYLLNHYLSCMPPDERHDFYDELLEDGIYKGFVKGMEYMKDKAIQDMTKIKEGIDGQVEEWKSGELAEELAEEVKSATYYKEIK